MAAQKWRWSPPRYAGSDHQIRHSLAGVDKSKNSTSHHNLKELPSRAALARKWPELKVNRYTGAWRDDATGAGGDNIESLLTFLGEGSR